MTPHARAQRDVKRRLLVVLVSVACTVFALVAFGAPKKKGESSSKSRGPKHAASESKSRGKSGKDKKPHDEPIADAGAGPRNVVGDAGASASGVKEAKQTDAGSSYKFGELEIEGRLKTPQIVYFLRRVRAEFAAQDLGHRSFSGELKETRKEPSF